MTQTWLGKNYTSKLLKVTSSLEKLQSSTRDKENEKKTVRMHLKPNRTPPPKKKTKKQFILRFLLFWRCFLATVTLYFHNSQNT